MQIEISIAIMKSIIMCLISAGKGGTYMGSNLPPTFSKVNLGPQWLQICIMKTPFHLYWVVEVEITYWPDMVDMPAPGSVVIP